MIFSLIVSLIGFLFGYRTLNLTIDRKLLNSDDLTKIGTSYFLAVLFVNWLLPHGHLSVWCAVFGPLASLSFLVFYLVKSRSRKFREALVEALAVISLKMKSGRSFRQSLSEVTAESEPWLRVKLSEIGSAVVFSQQETIHNADPFVVEFVAEMIRVDRLPHAAAKRLAIFREKLRIEDDFRRRSGQVLARIHAQSVVMTGLYVALGAFIAWKFGWRENIRLFISSGLLFALGLVWMVRGGRKMQWKV